MAYRHWEPGTKKVKVVRDVIIHESAKQRVTLAGGLEDAVREERQMPELELAVGKNGTT